MSNTESAIPAFDSFPEIQTLGREAIQGLSNEWLYTPIARKYNVKKVEIGGVDKRPLIQNIEIEHLHDPLASPTASHLLHFPLDDLLNYIIERGIASPEVRLRLKQLVRLKRDRSPFAFQRYKTQEPRRLYIRCKNSSCWTIFETQYTILSGQTWHGIFDPLNCPACGATSALDASDFFTMDVPDETPVEVKGMEDPTVTWFSVIVRWTPLAYSSVLPLIGRLNDAEFEGKLAETVFFVGPHATSSMPYARLYFLHRPQSFNKVFRPETHDWDEVRHAATNKTLYELGDFSVISKLKVEPLAPILIGSARGNAG
jgi:hypothetical protein